MPPGSQASIRGSKASTRCQLEACGEPEDVRKTCDAHFPTLLYALLVPRLVVQHSLVSYFVILGYS